MAHGARAFAARGSDMLSERRTHIEKEDGTVAVRAKTLWAMIDLSTGRPRRVPREVRASFLQSGDGDG